MGPVAAASEGARFAQDGIARAVGVIAPADLAAMRACALARLAAIELIEIAGARRPAPGHELALWGIGREPAFAPLPAALADALARVFGAGPWAQVAGDLGGVALPNFPSPGARRGACGVAWHTDEAVPPGATAPETVLAYACLAPVVAGGGATVVVTGSHRRLAALATARGAPIGHVDAPAALARVEPWFAALVERGEADGGCVSDGVPLGVAELTGAPGDVVFLDARCLHTISANVSAGPRLVMRLTCMAAAPA
ncbi:MAG: hypothetical protein JNK64_18515 [Myxococcales bacterium]|nr:hypothetical protein [Myxococcales bacterium]